MEKQIDEKVLQAKSGWLMLFISLIMVAGGIALFAFGVQREGAVSVVLAIGGAILVVLALVFINGMKVVGPNEALVLTLFGKYYGTLKHEGFFWINPFCSSVNPAAGQITVGGKKLSLKAMTLNNDKQKVNDEEGNPIEIGVVVIWKITNTARAVFCVDNYVSYISTQCDAAIRQVARQYPYDVASDGDEKSLRGSSQEIAEILKKELQGRVEMAGIEIMEARASRTLRMRPRSRLPCCSASRRRRS